MKIAKLSYLSKAKSSTSVLTILVLLLTPFVSIISQAPTAHATLAGFSAGNIMDDIVMSKKDALTQAQIQSFLKSKNACNDRGLSRLTGYNSTKGWLKANGTTYYYNLKDGHFICMADQDFNGESAAHIIWQAAQDYNLNPQVLIVLLEKEQGLVTDTWPNYNVQYRSATGFGCPDTAPCDAQYYGLKNQIRQAASLFREVLTGGWTNYPVGWNYIQYNPSASCGGSNVYVKNRATSSLYRYTPYQPNQAALNAGWGSAYPCGAYGNRNFYNLFTTWFGSTHAVFVNLLSPRWMQAKSDIYKRNPVTGETVGSVILNGSQIYFPKKITVNSKTYLQTQYDSDHGNGVGILSSDLVDINLTYSSLETPRWMETKTDIYKKDPITGKQLPDMIPAGTQLYIATKTTFNNISYLRTQYDTDNGIRSGIPQTLLADSTVGYVNLETPRWMETKTATRVYDVRHSKSIGDTVAAETQLHFTKKIFVNGRWYLAETLPASNDYVGIPLTDTRGISLKFVPLEKPRWMLTNSNVTKKDPITGNDVDFSFPQNTPLEFTTKVEVGGQWYLRTKYDSLHSKPYGIQLSNLRETPSNFKPLKFSALAAPRYLKVNTDTYSTDLVTLQPTNELIPAGTVLYFNSKILINNKWYLRTSADTAHSYARGILWPNSLSEL